MIPRKQLIIMRAVALCFKPYLKPEEALIYCNLARTQFAKKCEEYAVYKSNSGYFKKEDLDRMLAGELPNREAAAQKLNIGVKRTKHLPSGDG